LGLDINLKALKNYLGLEIYIKQAINNYFGLKIEKEQSLNNCLWLDN
jgi:hypothetical protein